MLSSLGFIPLAAAAYLEAGALAKAKAGVFGFGRCRESAAAAQTCGYYHTPMNCSGQPFRLRGSDNQGSLDQATAAGGAIDEYSWADIVDPFAEGRENRPPSLNRQSRFGG